MRESTPVPSLEALRAPIDPQRHRIIAVEQSARDVVDRRDGHTPHFTAQHREVLAVQVAVAAQPGEDELEVEIAHGHERRGAQGGEHLDGPDRVDAVLLGRREAEHLGGILERESPPPLGCPHPVEACDEERLRIPAIVHQLTGRDREPERLRGPEVQVLVLNEVGESRGVELEDVAALAERHRGADHLSAQLVLHTRQAVPVDFVTEFEEVELPDGTRVRGSHRLIRRLPPRNDLHVFAGVLGLLRQNAAEVTTGRSPPPGRSDNRQGAAGRRDGW
jgi:hypothetical protein